MTAEGAYEVRVTGRVPDREVLDALGEVEVAEQEVRTVLCGRFPDQAALYGFLHRLRAFGLEVVEVRRVGGADRRTGDADDRSSSGEGARHGLRRR